MQAIPAVKRRGVWGASVHSLVGSEEALRGFDELSNPGESLATFTGANVEESRGETIPPREYSPMSSEGATQELSFIEPLDSVPLGPPPIPGGGAWILSWTPELAATHIWSSSTRLVRCSSSVHGVYHSSPP